MSWTPSPCCADVLGDLAVRRERRREHEPDVVLDHHVARPVADLRLEAAERDRREAPQRPVVGARLAGVAHPELDVVDAVQRQEIAGFGVRVRVDPGAGLVGGALRDRLGHRSISPCSASRLGSMTASGTGPSAVVASNATPTCDTQRHGSERRRRPAAPRPIPAGRSARRRRGARAVAGQRQLRGRARVELVSAGAAGARGRDGSVLDGSDRADPRGLPGTRSVRAGPDRRGADRGDRSRPGPARGRAVRPDRRRGPSLRPGGSASFRPSRSSAAAPIRRAAR